MLSQNQVAKLIVSILLCVSFTFIFIEDAFAFNRGKVESGRFDKTKIVLDKTFGQPDGYIKKRELKNISPLYNKVNVYDRHGNKIGYAKKTVRANGLDVYDYQGHKTGFYRNTLSSPEY